MARNVPPVTSFVLDMTRFTLALSVAFGHWTQGYFQEAWPDLTNSAIVAVGGFFVLSGYTIRLLTPAEQGFSGLNFFVERLSRLWSVVLPALLITIVLDLASYLAGRDYYLQNWGLFTTYPWFRLAVNVGMVSQSWGWDIKPLSNSPFWSISYEAGFYLIYGLFRTLRGVRRAAAIGAVSLVLGPNVLLMMLLWLTGVALYDVTERAQRRAWPLWPYVAIAIGAVSAVAWFTFGPAPLLARELTTWIGAAFASAQAALGGFLGPLRLDPRRIDGYVIFGGLGFWLLFAAFLPLCRELDHRIQIPTRVRRVGRALGNFTFPLYLLHFPLFVLLGALGFYNRDSSLQKLACFALVCGVIFAIAPVFDVCKFRLRRYLDAATRPRGSQAHVGLDKSLSVNR